MAKKKKLALFKGDRSLWIIIAVLCVVSMLVVYSSTASMAYREVAGDTSHYLFRQARFIIFGFFIIMVVHWIDYRSYAKYARALFKLSLLLVVLAYIVGVSLNEAPRWIRIPVIGLTFQPSDLLKITLVMVLAQQLGARQDIINRIPILPSLSYWGWKKNPRKNIDIVLKTTQPLIVPIVLACAVVLPANLSTSMILFVVSVVILVTGRVRKGEIVRLVMSAVIALVIIVGVMKVFNVGRANVWVSRVTTYIEPLVGSSSNKNGEKNAKSSDDDFQIQQARIAIASAGVLGKGPGNSTQRSQLPHPYSDFAYAFIIEEYGIFGGAVIMILYLWIFYRAGVIVRRCNRPSAGLLVLGLALSITTQAFVNMAVSVGLLPVTGQTLPLISLGGSSIFFTCIAFGMILGISRESDEEEALLIELERQNELEEQKTLNTQQYNETLDSKQTLTTIPGVTSNDLEKDEETEYNDQDNYIDNDRLDTAENDDYYQNNNEEEDNEEEEEEDDNDDDEFKVIDHSIQKNDNQPRNQTRSVVSLYDEE